MIPLSLEALQTGEARRPRCRKIASRHDAEARGRDATFLSLYRPCVCLAVEDRLFGPGVELDIAPEVEAVSHMVDVTKDLRLRAVALGPLPFLLQLVREGIRVLHAFDIAATPRVAVPVPGAADDRIKSCGFWGACGQLGSPADCDVGGYEGEPPLFTTERFTRPPREL